MAKKATKSATAAPVKLTDKDKKTLGSLREVAGEVAGFAERSRAPHIEVPSRSLSNVRFNQSRKIIEMGSGTNRRELFNLSQAKAYMQTLLVGSGVKQLIDQGKTTSIRGMFYLLKHTIEGTSEETFENQDECDPIIEDVEVILDAMREELHLYAKNAGAMVGPITVVDTGDEIDCSRMGSGGYSVPSIVEPDIVQFKKSQAKFVLFVEKDAVWRRFNEDKFWLHNNCILIHGGGQPPRGVRRLIHRFHNELKLPVYCLLDNDPWGYYIYSVLKQGSINLAYESRRMAIPAARFMGIRSNDYARCELKPSATIKLNEQDIKRANQIKCYPWFEGKKAARRPS
jgi:DNA topoisomerase-6 subunit A